MGPTRADAEAIEQASGTRRRRRRRRSLRDDCVLRGSNVKEADGRPDGEERAFTLEHYEVIAHE